MILSLVGSRYVAVGNELWSCKGEVGLGLAPNRFSCGAVMACIHLRSGRRVNRPNLSSFKPTAYVFAWCAG